MSPSRSLLAAAFAAALLNGGSVARAASLPVVLDGEFDDWSGATLIGTDALGDGGGSGVDFQRIWAANDGEYLYLRFETGAEVQGDEQQDIRLYLDTDLDAGTGTSYQGIGADLVWNFGQRNGTFRGASIGHADVGLLLGPTVSNTEFEIALRLDARPTGGALLFPGNSMRLILRDADGAGDRAPGSGSFAYTLVAGSQSTPALPTTRAEASHLRLASFNVENDGLFEGGARQAALTRVLGAVDADVWVFCEVWNHDAAQVATRLEQLSPAGPGRSWSAVKRDSGNVIVSRYPILQSWAVLPGSRLTAARIDLDPDHDRDLLVIACHFSCCTADANRQEQADALIAFVRDAQTPGGAIDLPLDTPIVAAGDFNLVGWRQQLDTILDGDIVDNGTFGPDHAPDWDGSAFDLPPTRHTDARVAYTWRNDSSSFYPGLLDFTFVTQSVVGLGNHYVLDTRTMAPASLSAAGLLAGDTEQASDHSPRVLDLVYETGTDSPAFARAVARIESARPNPFNPRTEIEYVLEVATTSLRMDVFDVQGRRVRGLVDGPVGAGSHRAVWDGMDEDGRAVASGVYFVELRTGSGADRRKLTLVR